MIEKEEKKIVINSIYHCAMKRWHAIRDAKIYLGVHGEIKN